MGFFGDSAKLHLPAPGDALPGRDRPMRVPPAHTVLGNPMVGPFPGKEIATFGR